MLTHDLTRFGHLLPMSAALALSALLALHDTRTIVPLFLGVIAASLAELDYSGRQGFRVWRGLLLWFLCVSLLMSWSLAHFGWFALFFTVLTFFSTAWAALGVHYKTLAFGTLVVALYTALIHQKTLPFWYNPVHLVLGASVYAFMAWAWQSITPQRPVQSALAQVYAVLADYLQRKALFFNPDYRSVLPELQNELHAYNQNVIETLNHCRHVLFRRSPQRLLLRIQQYFTAQDIHERLSSSHVDYAQMAERFAHQDILFRFQNLIAMQAEVCRSWSLALRWGQSPAEPTRLALQAAGLESALQQQNYPEALRRVAHNLLQVNQLLLTLAHTEAQDPRIHAPQNHWRESWQILRQQWQQRHATLRHAGRLTILTALALLGIAIFGGDYSYWIVLTIIFVSQPNYSSTRSRVQQRMVGTITGVLASAFVPVIFPSVTGKVALMAVTTLCFFHFRSRQYAYSTFFITIEALTGMTLLGLNPAESLPWRFLDTLLGAMLAWVGARYLFPDTHYQRPEALFQQAKSHIDDYLQLVIKQSRQQENDDLALRLARRQAQEALVAFTQLTREWQSHGYEIAPLQQLHQELYALSGTVASLAIQIRSSADWQHDEILQNQLQETLKRLKDSPPASR